MKFELHRSADRSICASGQQQDDSAQRTRYYAPFQLGTPSEKSEVHSLLGATAGAASDCRESPLSGAGFEGTDPFGLWIFGNLPVRRRDNNNSTTTETAPARPAKTIYAAHVEGAKSASAERQAPRPTAARNALPAGSRGAAAFLFAQALLCCSSVGRAVRVDRSIADAYRGNRFASTSDLLIEARGRLLVVQKSQRKNE